MPVKCPRWFLKCPQPVISVFLSLRTLVKCWASDASGNSENSPLHHNPLTPKPNPFWGPRMTLKAACREGNKGAPSLLLPCSYFLLEWGEQICVEVAQPEPPREKMDVRMSPSDHHTTSCLYLFIYFGPLAGGILVPWPRIEAVPPAVEARSPNNWTAREVPPLAFIIFCHVSGLWLCPHWYIPMWISLLPGPRHPIFSFSQFLYLPQMLGQAAPKRRPCSASYFLAFPKPQPRFYSTNSPFPPHSTRSPTPGCFTRKAQALHLLHSWPCSSVFISFMRPVET